MVGNKLGQSKRIRKSLFIGWLQFVGVAKWEPLNIHPTYWAQAKVMK